jgi:hypothetical protein
MHKKYSNFEKEICIFCDENVGAKGLFSVFLNLWDEKKPFSKKNLIGLTEKIINDLIKQEILTEIEKPEELESPYGYYEILRHEDLIEKNGYIRKKLKYLN